MNVTKRLLKLLCLSSFRSIWVSAKMHLDEKETYKIPKQKKILLLLLFFSHIYYTLIGVSSQIRRADMDGSNVVMLVNVTSIRRTTVDIALDKVKKRLYFSDESNNRIKYLDLVSFQTHSVLSRNPRRPVGLTLFNGTLYWTGFGAAEMFSGAIYKADVKDVNFTSPIHEVVDLLSYPAGLYVHDATISESPGMVP